MNTYNMFLRRKKKNIYLDNLLTWRPFSENVIMNLSAVSVFIKCTQTDSVSADQRLQNAASDESPHGLP